MLTSGVVLSGRYRLDERIATGGMGDVWRGADLVLGREVAVKVLLPTLVTDPDFITRFRSEARIMAALRHPGVVQVFDFGADQLPGGDHANYLIMEFVTGEPLSRRIEGAGRLDVAETMSIVEQAARALETVHRRGVVHRDIKPSNLVVQDDGTVVLIDFGVARSTNVTSITNANAVPGTALYMAPEQAAGRPVSGATDIYALGAVAYCCLNGSPPFTGDNPLQVAVAHLDDDPPELPHDIPEAVRALVRRALEKNPASRFGSGAAMATAARAAVSGSSAPTAPPPAVGSATLRAAEPTTLTDAPVVKPYRLARRGPLVGAVAAGLVALAGLATALIILGDAEPTPSFKAPSPVTTAEPVGGGTAPPSTVATTGSAPRSSHRPGGSVDKPSPSPSPSVSVSVTADVSPTPSDQPTSLSPDPTGPSPGPTTTGDGATPTPSATTDADPGSET
ncbi:serine/threonine-protein kinase [Salinispora arenicola]|uniref:serine/threonine-protein kinase n=1 Tax=Salinispora arenicola TaxID=168697 RepID=UPI00169F4AE6|nr:protein kinase [Salinispora arenicola]NIL62268.1 protein kinase [Salinispora arenicola]